MWSDLEARARRQPTQTRAKAKVSAILDAADELLGEASVEALVMRDVARRASVKPATLYDYFPTKLLLLRGLEERAWARAAERVRSAIATTRDAPLGDAVAGVVEMFMTEMSAAARRYGLTPESPSGRGPREMLGAELAAAASAALDGRAHALRASDLRLRLVIASETVALLTWVASRDHIEALEDGSYAREVGRLIAHYLVRD